MSTYHCQHCNNELTFTQHFRSAFCEKPACQRAKVSNYFIENTKRITNQVSILCQEFLNTNKSSDNGNILHSNVIESINNTSANIVLLPANTRKLTPLADDRKLAFLQHLEILFKEVTQSRPSTLKCYTTKLDAPLPKHEQDLLGKACATCKGSCCRLGKEHAFQDHASLDYFLAKQPTQFHLKDILDLYESYFPETSYSNACVFQGNQGCTLPSDLRSFTCKNYRCDSLKSYHQDLISTNHDVTFAAAVEDETIRHIRVFNKEHFLTVQNNDIDCE